MGVDKDSPLPRHFQLREAIRRDVFKNGLKPGDGIPSERELGETYEVSRVTVRRAISDLVEEGFLRREGRRGTFVNDASRAGMRTPDSERRLIGVLFSRIQTAFTDRLLMGIDDQCHERGYSVVFGSTDESPGRTAEQIERMAAEGVAGFIIVPLACDDYREVNNRLLDQVRSWNLPFVLLDRHVPGVSADTVISDNFDGAYRATQHLVDRGHRRIAFIGYFHCSAVEERIAGYEKCLRDNGIFPDETLVTHPRPEQVKQTVSRILEKTPDLTAIFAVNDAKAVIVWERLREMGLQVPGDIALVGYDNLYGSSGPGALLTTAEQPLEDEGRLACKMLLERIGGYTGEPRFAVLKSVFIVGQSTALPAAASNVEMAVGPVEPNSVTGSGTVSSEQSASARAADPGS